MNEPNLHRIVLINGATSSGKTTIARELRASLDEMWLLAGIDRFWGMPDERFMERGELARDGFFWEEPTRESDVIRIRAGPAGLRLVRGMHRAVAAMAAAGNNLIVDDVLLDPSWLQDWLEVTRSLPVWFIGLYCPIEVLEARERARGDRILGEARGQVDLIHKGVTYDLELDTSILRVSESVESIKDRLKIPPTAFEEMRNRRLYR